MAKHDGGQAFPTLMKAGEVAVSDGGMSLRDYFAAQALTGLLAEQQPDNGEPELGLGREYAANAAKAAYRLADAMIAERGKGGQ